MRTTLIIDDKILSDVITQTGKNNRSEAVRMALQEYLKIKRKQQVISMRGTVDVEDNWELLRKMEKAE